MNLSAELDALAKKAVEAEGPPYVIAFEGRCQISASHPIELGYLLATVMEEIARALNDLGVPLLPDEIRQAIVTLGLAVEPRESAKH